MEDAVSGAHGTSAVRRGRHSISIPRRYGMTDKTFEELFVDELRDIRDAEHRMVKALPKLIKGASSKELSVALKEHLGQTEEHVLRLDQSFEQLDEKPGQKVCEAMKGLLEEAEELLDESNDPAVKDAAIIAAAQKVEHYEMATYGTLREWARQLGFDEIASRLQKTLDEEEMADKRLTVIAESRNYVAATESRRK
jgi:ferritin-like metal-binding protein YciE